MKNIFNNVKKWIDEHRTLVAFILMGIAVLLAIMCQSHEHALAMALVAGVEGGTHVVDGPLTTDVTREAAPELLLNEIDKQITKIRPMATPIDQLSRCAGSKHSGSMIVDYHNVDTKPTMAQVATSYTAPSAQEISGEASRIKLMTSNDEIFDSSDTILVQGV
ncbi:MAG: hypothetical protein IK092_05785, partial [Muribaculaceae bacterium]|nr:hypothetical protein [Muribaculaceae bacterium]